MIEVGFMGMGNVGDAILNGLPKTYRSEEMIFSAARQDRAEAVTARIKVSHACSNRGRAEMVECLILAVEPQYSDAVFSEVRDMVMPEQVVASLAPGITISNITERLGGNVRMVKVMSNAPAMLGEGMIDVSYGETPHTEREKGTVRDIFPSCGRVELVEKRLMDAVGCVSGSPPTFVYMFIETLADSGVKYDPPRKTAHTVAAQAVFESTKMILETGRHLGQLKDEVCSPGGITIAGVSALEGYGPKNAVIKAADACYERTRRMK